MRPSRSGSGPLKRHAERWREIPVPPELLRALELAHALRSAPAKTASRPLWPWSRATTANRKIARLMTDAGIEGPKPIRTVSGTSSASRPSPPAYRSRRSRPPWATPTCRPPQSTSPLQVSRRGSFWPGCGKRRGIRADPTSEGLWRERVARMAWAMTRKDGLPCELRALLEPRIMRFGSKFPNFGIKAARFSRSALAGLHLLSIPARSRSEFSLPQPPN